MVSPGACVEENRKYHYTPTSIVQGKKLLEALQVFVERLTELAWSTQRWLMAVGCSNPCGTVLQHRRHAVHSIGQRFKRTTGTACSSTSP